MSTNKELKKALLLIKKYRDTQYKLNKIQLARIRAENELSNFKSTQKKPLFSSYFKTLDCFDDTDRLSRAIDYLMSRYSLNLEEAKSECEKAKLYNDTYYSLLTKTETLIYTENLYAEQELKNIRIKYEYLIDNSTLYEDFGLTYNIIDMMCYIN